MMLLDPDWNPSNDAQVMGRIWRVGQTREVFIYRLYASNSIEERILDMQRNKETLSDTVIDGKQAISHKRFSTSVLKTLFDFREEIEGKHISDKDFKVVSKAILLNSREIQKSIDFYDLKVTEFDPENNKVNAFDMNKKETPIKDSEETSGDETQDTTTVGRKRKLKPQPTYVKDVKNQKTDK